MVCKIDICNLALAQLGQDALSSLTQEDERARRCNLFYEPVKQEVLRTHNWGFAGVCEALALVENNPDAPLGYVYQYPADALFVRRVFRQDGRETPCTFKEAYLRRLNTRILQTAEPEAYCEYTKDIKDERLFDSAFVKSFSLALAVDLTLPLTGDNALAQSLIKKYTLSLDEARRSNMSENYEQKLQQSVFVEVR